MKNQGVFLIFQFKLASYALFEFVFYEKHILTFLKQYKNSPEEYFDQKKLPLKNQFVL